MSSFFKFGNQNISMFQTIYKTHLTRQQYLM